MNVYSDNHWKLTEYQGHGSKVNDTHVLKNIFQVHVWYYRYLWAVLICEQGLSVWFYCVYVCTNAIRWWTDGDWCLRSSVADRHETHASDCDCRTSCRLYAGWTFTLFIIKVRRERILVNRFESEIIKMQGKITTFVQIYLVEICTLASSFWLA